MTMFDAMKMNRAAEQAKREDDIKESFEKWLLQPLVKMLISTIPQPEGNPEGVTMLLRECWEKAYAAGAGSVVVGLIDSMMRVRAKDLGGRDERRY